MLTGLPDLALPIADAPGVAFSGFGRNGLVVAVPDRLALEADAAGRPQLRLALMRASGTTVITAGRLELGLSIDADLAGIGRALTARGAPASLVVAEPEGGVLTVETSLGPPGQSALAPPLILPPGLLTRARVSFELGAEASALAARLIEESVLPLHATMRLLYHAVAPRLPLAVSYDPRAAAQRLAARLDGAAVVDSEALERALEAVLLDPEVVIEGEPEAIEPRLRARTLVLRLRDRFATQDGSDPGKHKLRAVHELSSLVERLDFAVPAMVVAEQVITIDPLAAARAMQAGTPADLVRHIDVDPVPTGRQRIALSANLPEPVAGLQVLFADFRAPALPPFRPHAVTASVSLRSPGRRGEAVIRLAMEEDVAGEARLRAVVERHGEAVEITGPWRAMRGPRALLGPDDFGVPFFVLRASRALTALAVVEAVAGTSVVARLDADIPMISIPMMEQGLRIIARPLAGGRDIEIEAGSSRRLDLDPATLPGFGAHHARLVTSDSKRLLVEWRADGDDDDGAPLSVRLGADRPTADIGWVASSPFRPGMSWRAVRDGRPGPWSAPVLPREELLIRIEEEQRMDVPETLTIDGIEVRTSGVDESAWTYVPLRPTFEQTQSGAPAFSIVEAGTTAFLQCTARVALNEDERGALLRHLQEKKPKARTLEAAPLTVERISLEIRTADEWVVFAESKGSGLPPWNAALTVMLAPGPLAAIKSAVGGEKDRARLQARIVLAGPASSFQSSRAASEIHIKTPGGTVSSLFTVSSQSSPPGTTASPRDLSADLSEFFQPGRGLP